jgi:hypothetical protein
MITEVNFIIQKYLQVLSTVDTGNGGLIVIRVPDMYVTSTLEGCDFEFPDGYEYCHLLGKQERKK